MPRSEKQKLKILYIAKYLWEQTDEAHGVTGAEIVDYLEDYGITAEVHSVYRDIALLRDEFGFDIEGGRGKNYRLLSRNLDYDDIRTLAECVSATRYVPKGQAARLVNALGELCSEYQREALESEIFVNDRTRTEVRSVFVSAAEIRRAMRESKKIKFKYATASIDDVKKTAFRRYITVDRANTDRFAEVSATIRVILIQRLITGAKGVFPPLLQIVDIAPDDVLRNIGYIGDIHLFSAPPFKKAQRLFITVHRFLAQLSASAMHHEFIDLPVKT